MSIDPRVYKVLGPLNDSAGCFYTFADEFTAGYRDIRIPLLELQASLGQDTALGSISLSASFNEHTVEVYVDDDPRVDPRVRQLSNAEASHLLDRIIEITGELEEWDKTHPPEPAPPPRRFRFFRLHKRPTD
jgi:hypothetical protein